MNRSPLPAPPPAWLPVGCGLIAFAIAAAVFWSFDAPWTLRGDNKAIMFPMNLEAFRIWSEGRAPQWSGGFWFGFPLLADPTSLSLYWPNLLAYLATPAPHLRAYDLSTAAHAGLLVGGVVWLLALLGVRRWIAAFGGLLILLMPMHVWYASAMITGYAPVCWWPLMLVAAEMLSRPGPRLGYLVLAWIALGSCALVYPEFALYGGCVSSLWLLTRSVGVPLVMRAELAVVVGLGGLALAAPQLLPTLYYLPDTTRAGEIVIDFAQILFRAPMLLYPNRLEKIPSFLGIATLVLAVLGASGHGQRRHFLLVLALGTFLTSLGPFGPTYEALHSLPVFEMFRQPMKFKLLTELAVVLLAGLGLERVMALAPAGLAARLLATLVAMVIAEQLAYSGVRVYSGEKLPGDTDESFATLYGRLADSQLRERLELVAPPQPTRIFERVNLRAIPMIDEIHLAGGGNNSLMPQRHQDVVQALRAWPRPTRRDLNFLGIRYSLEAAPETDDPDSNPCLRIASSRGLLLSARNQETCLYFNRDRPGLVDIPQTVSHAESVESMIESVVLALRKRTSVLTYAHSPIECLQVEQAPSSCEAEVRLFDHELSDSVPIVSGDRPVYPKRRAFGRAVLLDYQDGRLFFTASSNKPGFAIVRESYSTGWEAAVNGERVPIYPASGLFFAVPIPAGRSEVLVEYRAAGFRTGVRIAVGWIALVCVAELLRRMLVGVRSRAAPAPTAEGAGQ